MPVNKPTTLQYSNRFTALNGTEIKTRLLEMLDLFVAFCTQNNIRFSLSGGTLLGAIRHHGFIPWDDDIDLCVPRPDYEKLLSMRNQFYSQTGLEITGFMDLDPHETPFIKIIDKNYPAKIGTDIDWSFLWIDVFPVDGLPEDLNRTKMIYNKALLCRRFIFLLISTPESKSNSFARLFMKTIGTACRALPGSLKNANKSLDKINKSITYGATQYCGVVGWGMYGAGERFSKSDFENFTTVDFEGHKYPAMGCWHEYLTGIYGDYMQLPPIDKRKTHQLVVLKRKNT